MRQLFTVLLVFCIGLAYASTVVGHSPPDPVPFESQLQDHQNDLQATLLTTHVVSEQRISGTNFTFTVLLYSQPYNRGSVAFHPENRFTIWEYHYNLRPYVLKRASNTVFNTGPGDQDFSSSASCSVVQRE